MKKFAIILLAVASLMVISCKQSVPDKLIKLADKAEKEGEKWSQEKWEQVGDEFTGLLDEYTSNEDSYGPLKKLKVLAATTKFYAVAVKYVVAPEAKAKLKGLSDDDDADEDSEESELDKAISAGAEEVLEGLKGLGL